MLSATRPRWLSALCALALLTAGCDLWNRTTGDEERELHYVQGLNWKIQGQTEKAIESFSRALQTNPNSAAAHLALGDLHYNGTHNFIVAAYHYHEFLRIKEARQPDHRDQTVEDLIKNCELQIAAKYANAVARQENQIALEALRLEVTNLREENKMLKRAAGLESLRVTATNPPVQLPRTNAVAAPPAQRTVPAPVPGPSVPQVPAQTPKPTAARTYKIQANDTPSSIARRYGISTKMLMAANPGLRANALRVGQVINLPPP